METQDFLPSQEEWADILRDDDVSAEKPSTTSIGETDEGAAAKADDSSTRTDGRDERGRFVSKQTDADSTGPAEKSAASAPEATAPDATAEADTAAPETASDDFGPTEALTWKSGDTNWEFPGAVVTQFGTVIPPDKVELLKAALGKASSWDTTRDERQRDKLELRYQKEQLEERQRGFEQALSQQFAYGEQLIHAKTDEEYLTAALALAETVKSFAQQKDLLHREADLRAREAEIRFRHEAAQPDLAEQLAYRVNEQIAAAKQMPEFSALTDREYRYLYELVLGNPKAWITETQTGPAFLGDQFANLLRREAHRTRELEQLRQEQAKGVSAAKKVAQQNALRQAAKPVAKAPIAVQNRPADANDTPRRQTRDEFEADLRRQLEAALQD